MTVHDQTCDDKASGDTMRKTPSLFLMARARPCMSVWMEEKVRYVPQRGTRQWRLRQWIRDYLKIQAVLAVDIVWQMWQITTEQVERMMEHPRIQA